MSQLSYIHSSHTVDVTLKCPTFLHTHSPRIRLHIAVRAILRFWNDPNMCIFLFKEKDEQHKTKLVNIWKQGEKRKHGFSGGSSSRYTCHVNSTVQLGQTERFQFSLKRRLTTHVSASTIRVFVTFSMVNLVFPPFPAILPTALDKWSPFSGFTAKIAKHENLLIRAQHMPKEPTFTLQLRKRMVIQYGVFQSGQELNSGDNLPSVTSKVSKKSSSNLMRARAS